MGNKCSEGATSTDSAQACDTDVPKSLQSLAVALFDKMDKDGTGELEVDELTGWLSANKNNITAEEILAIANDIDKNQDHKIQKPEFVNYFKAQYHTHKNDQWLELWIKEAESHK